MTHHTPGPWTTDQKAEGLRLAKVRFSSCTCCYHWITVPHLAERADLAGGVDEAAANARLMAAAPDLYAALRGLAEWVARQPASSSRDGFLKEGFLDWAQMALEKARYYPPATTDGKVEG